MPRRWIPSALWWFALVTTSISVLGGCGWGGGSGAASGADTRPRLHVLAASSLTDVLPAIDDSPRYQFGPSDALATQVREGANVDVILAANTSIPCELWSAGLVGKPVAFASNRIVLIVPTGSKIRSLDDLAADRHAAIVVARPGVPIGDYTQRVLDALGASDLDARARSQEQDARAVTSKVALGEADAGFAYATDTAAVGDQVQAVELPATPVNHARYAMAVVTASDHPRRAAALVRSVTGDRGQAQVRAAGFGTDTRPVSCAESTR